jgi:phenol hydroxylase P4 protein
VLPLSLDTTFEQLQTKVLPKLYAQHPDFGRIAWSKVQWFRGDVMFTPKATNTLAAQGFGHKSVLRFRTPGLEGLRGSCG